MDILSVIDRLGDKENLITEKEIISPVFYNTEIVTRIEGLIHFLKISKMDPGWYKFKPLNEKEAQLISPAEIDEIEKYLKHLPKIRLILVYKKGPIYFGVPIKGNKFGLKITELLPVYLSDDMATDFSKCICRYDGINIWYQETDIQNDFEKIEYLNKSIKKFRENIRFSGLSIEEKIAYKIKFEIDKKLKEELNKTKIQRDIEYGGGKFLKSTEKSDHIEVSYEIEGEKFTSYVSKDPTHKIITAGICLSDYETGHTGDSDYDLKSITSVIREGKERKAIYRTLR